MTSSKILPVAISTSFQPRSNFLCHLEDNDEPPPAPSSVSVPFFCQVCCRSSKYRSAPSVQKVLSGSDRVVLVGGRIPSGRKRHQYRRRYPKLCQVKCSVPRSATAAFGDERKKATSVSATIAQVTSG